MIIKVPRHGRALLPVFNLYQTHKGPFSFQMRLDFLTFGESLHTSSKSDEKWLHLSISRVMHHLREREMGWSKRKHIQISAESFSPSQCPESCVLACVLQQRPDLSR
jgi:hypothetical protein